MNERIEKLKSFLKGAPKDCFLNHALALEYIKTGNDAEAMILFENNIANDAGYVATYYHLGKLLESLGNINEAVNVYEKGMVIAKKANDMHTYNELQSACENLAY